MGSAMDASMIQVSTSDSELSPQRRHLFQNAAGFDILGGQFISGDVHYHAISPPPVIDFQFDEFTVAEHSSEADSDIYCRQLLRRKRGFPLYVPGPPQRNLPEEYQQKGVSIGDVGRVTPEGVFDFFFNIYLPADHPINCGAVPEDFVPLEPYLARDIMQLVYDPGNYVSSPSVHVQNPYCSPDDFPGSEISFRCQGPSGAVLILPQGSHLERLQNVEDLRRYAAQNAESWYKYINGVRGRGLVNGALLLVTGCEKSGEGGLASFQNVRAGNDFQLVYKETGHPIGYRFRRGTPATTKSFRNRDHDLLNHTVFFHGFTISIGQGIWGRLFGSIGVSQITNIGISDTAHDQSGLLSFGSPGSLLSWILNLSGGASQFSGKKYLGQHGEETTLLDIAGIPEIFHPSRLLNNFILDQVPEAKVVITHDGDWCDIVCEAGVDSIQQQRYFLEKVAQQFMLAELDSGTYSLVSKAALNPNQGSFATISTAVGPGSGSSEELMPRSANLTNRFRKLVRKSRPPVKQPKDLYHDDANKRALPQALACLFCRQRKIACSLPVGGSGNAGCYQCQHRALVCELALPDADTINWKEIPNKILPQTGSSSGNDSGMFLVRPAKTLYSDPPSAEGPTRLRGRPPKSAKFA